MREVAVVGIGITQFGEIWEKSLKQIWYESAVKAIEDARVDRIDSMYVGCMSSGLFVAQEHLASQLADYLGMGNIPATRVESACCSGALAFKTGFLDVASGYSDIVLVTGVEKMTDVSGGDATFALSTAADQEYEVYNGVTFPGLYAMMANAYMERYGLTREELAEVAVKNHYHASLNPNAQFPVEITAEQVMKSAMVADPLRILDCSPISDGSAAVVLMPFNQAKKEGREPLIKVRAIGHATDSISYYDREDLTWLKAVELSAERAYKEARLQPKNINLVEVHDCFTIAEIIIIEALGFFERGKGRIATPSGLTRLGGRIPVNVSGGLKGKGHPVGATGVAQIVEIVTQLRGEAGKRQVENAVIGMAQNMGGSGGSSIVTILEKY